jgi:hypothetical protein
MINSGLKSRVFLRRGKILCQTNFLISGSSIVLIEISYGSKIENSSYSENIISVDSLPSELEFDLLTFEPLIDGIIPPLI